MRISIFLIFLSILLAAEAQAEGDLVYIGALGGLSFPSLSSSSFGYGGKVGVKVLPRLWVGGFYYTNGIGFQTNSGDNLLVANTAYTQMATEATLSMSKGFSLGARVGIFQVAPVVNAVSGTNSITFSDSNSYLFISPVLSYEYPVGPITIGADISYTYSLSSSGPKQINFLGMIKLYL